MPLGHAVRASRSLIQPACLPNPQVVMSTQQNWHEGSRADYITSLALARSHAEGHGRPLPSHSHLFHHRDAFKVHPPKHMPNRLQPSTIPDLRFEPTYLAKLEAAESGWKSIVWITIREHAISPLLQGVLWCVAFEGPYCFVQLTCQTCTGVPRPFSYNRYCDPLCGGDIRAIIRDLRKKAVSQAGSADGPTQSFHTRGWGARPEHDDGCRASRQELTTWIMRTTSVISCAGE